MGNKLPKYAEKILLFFLPKRDREFLIGDYNYLYHQVLEDKGNLQAGLWYLFIVLKSVPQFTKHQIYWGVVMLLNYLKIAIRNIKKQKVNSFINISGLAVGLAAVILLLLYIQYELSYDRYHVESDNIYRVEFERKETGEAGIFLPATIGPLLKTNFPEVENSIRVMKRDERLISYNNKRFMEKDIIFADPEIFDIFSFSLVEGNEETALNNPNSMILSRAMADKYFGSESPMGKVIRFEDKHDFQVTGVLNNIPQNSHFNVNFLIPFTTVKQIWTWIDLDSWRISMYATYFRVKDNSAIDQLTKKIISSIDENAGPEFSEAKEIYCQPLNDIHLKSHTIRDFGENAEIKQIYILASIAFLILLIALFNYVNLTAGQSSRRIKEIGVRKVIGANKNQLLRQFIGESFILTSIAFLIAFAIVWLALPTFNVFVGRNISLDFLISTQFLVWLSALICSVSLFAGLYPAFAIASILPSPLLGKSVASIKKSKLRNSLIVAQFSISVILLIVTFAIKSQMEFVESTEVGFAKENILVVDILDDNVSKNKAVIKSKLLANSNVLAVAASSYLPNQSEGTNSLNWAGKAEDNEARFYFCAVDYDFLDLYEIKMADGRKFSKEHISDDQGAIIINEAAMNSIGWETIDGKELSVPRFGGPPVTKKMVGVVKDFNMLSLHESIVPFFFHLNLKHADTYLSIKTSGNDREATLDFIQKTIQEYSTTYPVVYNYFDDIFKSYYSDEQKLGNVFSLFSVLAIAIACMGLFGLALMSSIQRTKEIGIRKVFGASVLRIAAKFSYEFARYVLIANVIAWPLAYFTANLWLDEFAYRIAPQLWMFLCSLGLALILALVTVGYHTIKAAIANPIESLRTE